MKKTKKKSLIGDDHDDYDVVMMLMIFLLQKKKSTSTLFVQCIRIDESVGRSVCQKGTLVTQIDRFFSRCYRKQEKRNLRLRVFDDGQDKIEW